MKNESKLLSYELMFWFFVIVGITVLVLPMVHVSSLIDFCFSGLTLNIVGTLVLVVFGLPQPDYSGGGFLRLEDGNTDEETGKPLGILRAEGPVLARWHKRISFVGIVDLLAGFVLQLVDHVISTSW